MAPTDSQQPDGNANSENSPSPHPTDSAVAAPASNLQPEEASSRANRQAMVTAYTAQGAIHNPPELPPVDGTWHWLEQADRIRAQALVYATPIEVTVARSTRDIGIGLDTPNVIFMPNLAHFNPDEQPESEGYWSYLSFADDNNSARGLARIQFGRQDAYGFEDVPYPSARQVWQLRQRMMAQGRDLRVFDGIDIVWTTIERNIQGAPPLPTSPGATSENGLTPPTNADDIDKDVFDEKPPHHRHDLTNGGEHDQTGAVDLHWYRTIYIRGEKFTCDVSTAALDRPEPHKCWIPSKKGEWKQWKHAGILDWSNKKHIKDLNSWRDQALKRGGWPGKRAIPRDDYGEGEKEWLFDVVSENKGEPPGTEALRKITKDFNKRFGAKRSQAAISAVGARLSKMYKKNDGKFVVGPGRGEFKAEEKRKREESEASSMSGPSPKRTRPSQKKDQDSGDESSDDDAMAMLEKDHAAGEEGVDGSRAGGEEDQEMAGVDSEDGGDDEDAEMGDGDYEDEQA